MNRNLIKLFLLLSLAVIAFLILKPAPKVPVSEQEMANIAKAVSNEFTRATSAQTKPAQVNNQSANGPAQQSNPAQQSGPAQQSIIGAIYKKADTTWFFKAKDTREKVDAINAAFKNYFVDQLKFDQDEQPILTHIPESMRAANTSSMRIATFRLNGVEVSVTRLAGNQDVNANVQRWMKQVGLAPDAEIQLEYKDNKNTILVKMPK